MLARCVDVLLAERVHDVGTLEQTRLLLRRQSILDVTILKDLRETAATPVLAGHVRDHLLFRGATAEEGREQATETRHRAIV
jgi:hypothetical protein